MCEEVYCSEGMEECPVEVRSDEILGEEDGKE